MKAKSVNQQLGILYLGLLLAIALLSISSLKVVENLSLEIQREQEIELLDYGRQVATAIGRYYENSPGAVKAYPRTLESLLYDERLLGLERYLRKLRPDPMTGSHDWIVLYARDGGIKGISSSSSKRPLRKGGFDKHEAGFATAESYRDWKFLYEPKE